MEPLYMNENRYSYLVGSWRRPANADYEAETPETEFERRVQNLFMEGQAYLHNEEYYLALNAFRELMALILHTANPQMPVDPNQIPWLVFPLDVTLIDPLITKAATILQKTPAPDYKFPSGLLSEESILPGTVMEKLKPALEQGMQVTSYHEIIGDRLKAALNAAEEQDYRAALRHYAVTLNNTPENDLVLRASILHDMAILSEKMDLRDQAIDMAQQSTELFEAARQTAAQVEALDTLTGILRRAGREDQAAEQSKRVEEIRKRNNINPIVGARRAEIPETLPSVPSRPRQNIPIDIPGRPPIRPFDPGLTNAASLAVDLDISTISTVDAPILMATKYVQPKAVTKAVNIMGDVSTATIRLDGNATADVKGFLQTISDTQDLRMVADFWVTPVQMVAYLPHMYFFVIPMAMGDCLAGLGNLGEAEAQYLSVLPYPFINKTYEIVKLWTRLAQVYLDMGDQDYRKAKDDTAAFGPARAAYENIVMLDKTLKPTSPLYQNAKFAAIKTRVANFLAADDPLAVNENPAITRLVMEALVRLQQIDAGLNFFGFSPDYVPPFSFEYLQNTARYFAQQASQIEQRYIQFKSTAENEELRREQLDQQAEVARQTVILEQRGVAEAQAGINVAQANLNYAEVQRQNAVAARDDFNAVRWELLELAEAEAWASAAAVDEDDEIRQTWDGYYYDSSKKRRSLVLQDLAYRRTRISHDLEAAKLQRSIDSAVAYKAVALAQVAQAQARRNVALQRVVIAQLQQRHAEENRDFLDMKEFSARLWYELASQARRLSQRYLDMATEIAFLMERAYNAETERGLNVIRYDYSSTPAGNLMGADFLMQDIDYFTLDHVTTVKTKKIPIKKVISLADEFPMAFHLLRTTGQCVFQTELEQFDREQPGLYLCKIRNVELLLVGITGSTSFAGSLRNVGVSKFRREDGSIVTRLYPADVMPLSQYSVRQDALVFRFNPNDLRLFENNGIDTLWQLEMPLHANQFNFNELIDVHLVLYYDGFFSPTLEAAIKASLPMSGNASRSFSMRMWFPDELFYLKNKGEAELEFSADLLPFNQVNFKRNDVTLQVSGTAAAIDGLTLRLVSQEHGAELVVKTDANGEVNDSTPGQPLRALRNENLLDKWSLFIKPEDNPHLVNDGSLDLSSIQDVQAFFEYSFDYRT